MSFTDNRTDIPRAPSDCLSCAGGDVSPGHYAVPDAVAAAHREALKTYKNNVDELLLGSKRKNVAGSDPFRRDRMADQRTAARIYRGLMEDLGGPHISGRGVTLCAWTQIAKQKTQLVRIDVKGKSPRSFWRGLQKCDLRWVCPVCTATKSMKSLDSMNAGLAMGRKAKLSPVMMTLTARHDRTMPLADLWSRLGQAEKALKKTRAWKQISTGPMRKGGFAKAVEVTHGDRSGFHPHAHIVMLLDLPELEAVACVSALRGEWLYQLERVGLDGTSDAARRHACQVQGAAQIGNYVTKWGLAHEMALGPSKVARGEGRTMWQLLRDARCAPTFAKRARAKALWVEATQAMIGTHQLRMSPAFRALVALYEEPEEPHEEEVETTIWECDHVKNDPDRQWDGVRNKRLACVEAAESTKKPRMAVWAVNEVLNGVILDSDLTSDEDEDNEDDIIEEKPHGTNDGDGAKTGSAQARPAGRMDRGHDPGGSGPLGFAAHVGGFVATAQAAVRSPPDRHDRRSGRLPP